MEPSFGTRSHLLKMVVLSSRAARQLTRPGFCYALSYVMHVLILLWQDMARPRGTRGLVDVEPRQKEYMRVSVSVAYRQWIAQLPHDKCADAPCETTFRTWMPFNVKLAHERQSIGCVCVHHATHDSIERGIHQLRKVCHSTRQSGESVCKFNCRCLCQCTVCTLEPHVPLLEAAVCTAEGGELPSISCVLQDCSECGLEKVLQCSAMENSSLVAETMGSVRKYVPVTRTAPGCKPKTKVEPHSVKCSLEGLFNEMRASFKFMLMHDYLAQRLAKTFRSHLDNLEAGNEVWVSLSLNLSPHLSLSLSL